MKLPHNCRTRHKILLMADEAAYYASLIHAE
jgi:hypothetical protein